jgi:hypothetical protein
MAPMMAPIPAADDEIGPDVQAIQYSKDADVR